MKKAEEMRDYQTEVLNKCVKRHPNTEHPNVGLLYRIGEQVPEPTIRAALMTMQDAHENNRNWGEDSPHVDNLEAYYFATLKGMCKEQGITTSFWKD